MNLRYFLFVIFCIAIIGACKQQRSATTSANSETSMFGGISPYAQRDYHPSAERLVDIIHTSLEVTPEWKSRYLYGKATIDVKPYFYPTSIIELDARGMEIKKMMWADSALAHANRSEMIGDDTKWRYENDVIRLDIGGPIQRNRTLTIYIEYIAKPNELREGGSAAISSDKGLYFIDPDDTDPNIPRQFWTQGETQASSAWFPTIDRPNERMTTEIKMHVDSNLVTLSNGILVSSTKDEDGLKVDHWKMDLPHAPYLVMMAAGDFKIVKDQWRGKEVSYYVEPQFEPYARDIFGKTPEMLEFFSNKLGVEYPWAKYSQICAREYVSGAMENTTATLHSDFLQLDKRELIDGSYEDYISHELFHQWFGDYVTCESWSNLPLNESFATYGEYLWREHKYGKVEADMHHYGSLRGYLREAGVPYNNPNWPGKQEPLIRYNYESQEDMFDAHSYNKGGQVLHMLRQHVGDEAFFASLKLYLETNKFQSVEIHNLRLAFEQVTGRDLNWFFNQWFLSAGHPELDITYSWNEKMKEEMVIIKQVQDFNRGVPVFYLPLDVDIYVDGKPTRQKIVVDAKADTFRFDAAKKPDFVNVDPQKTLLAWKQDHHTAEEWAFQYRNCAGYVNKIEALEALAPNVAETPIAKTIVASALQDETWDIRREALRRVASISDSLFSHIVTLAREDSSADVRSTALYILTATKDSAQTLKIAREMLNDSSYSVFTTALWIVATYDHENGLKTISQYENESHRQMKLAVAQAYAAAGSDAQQPWFEKTMFTMYGNYAFGFLYWYSEFLQRCSTATVEKALDGLERLHNQTFSTNTKFACKFVMRRLQQFYKVSADEAATKIDQLGGPKKSNPRVDALKEKQRDYERMMALLEARRKALK